MSIEWMQCAVKCVNGTFVGKRTNGVVAFKGIPSVGEQPTGNLRWKAPVEWFNAPLIRTVENQVKGGGKTNFLTKYYVR